VGGGEGLFVKCVFGFRYIFSVNANNFYVYTAIKCYYFGALKCTKLMASVFITVELLFLLLERPIFGG
jgi:hypothetical protein